MCRFAVELSMRAHTWMRSAEIKHRRPCSPWSRHHDDVINGNIFHVTGLLWLAGEFPSQRPVTPNSDVFFDLHLNKRLCKQTKRRWFGVPCRSLWRHSNDGRKKLSSRVSLNDELWCSLYFLPKQSNEQTIWLPLSDSSLRSRDTAVIFCPWCVGYISHDDCQ